MFKVLIADKLSVAAAEIFKARGLTADVKVGLSPEELKKIIGEYDGLAVRSDTKVTADILNAAKKMKVIGRAGIGVDNIDVTAASGHGIVVMNTPFGNSITTAEHAIAMMFALARQIPQANESTQAGKWEKSKFMGVELTAKTLGVVGCGNIGSIVAVRGLGLKMKVIAYDPFLSPERAKDLGVEAVDLDTLLARADFVTLHTPLTDKTKHMINRAAIAKMKKGARLINCARGELVVEEDLKAALESGHLAGAALDVFAVEPAKSNVLFGLPNVVATPHLGASTAEAQENVAVQVAEQIADFLLSGAVVNAVNMASMSAEDAPKLKPYLRLAELLGLFVGQITESAVESVEIAYEGLVADLNTKPVTAALLAGLLRPVLDGVNLVSAPIVARERNIQISETKRAQTDNYHTLVRLLVKTSTETHYVAGTLFSGDRPRLVMADGVPLEASLGKNILFTRNEDKPGYIGAIGQLLAQAGINIATFHLGRDKPGGQAMTLIEVDGPMAAGVLKKVSELSHVQWAKGLVF